MRTIGWKYHLVGLLTPLSATVALLLGGPFAASTIVLLLLVYPMVELLLGKHEGPPNQDQPHIFTSLAIIHALFVPLNVMLLLFVIWKHGYTETSLFQMVSVVLSSGASGIVAAHELGHRRPHSFPWWCSQMALFSVMYGHFTTEHNHTHHKHWAREEDPTSSPLGRGFYRHLFFTIPRQWMNALRIKPQLVVHLFLVELIFIGGLFSIEPRMVAGFLFQSLIAIILLEYVNYIQHHGLKRGVDERANARHAWESRHILSRITLMELPLHPSHHLRASTPYQKLQLHDESPQLPYGYFTLFWMVMVPPLFHRLIHASLNPSSLQPVQ